jgi:hypothetical protein
MEENPMSTQPIDYSAIVADLEAKKAAIENTLASLRSAIALGALGQPGDAPAIPGAMSASSIFSGDIPDGAFHGKGIPEATKLYLEIVKKKQTASEIANALKKGGMESTSSDFLAVVKAGLNRARKLQSSPLVKIGKHWGLKPWYPKGIAAGIASPAKKAKKKQRNKAAKAAEPKPQETAKARPPEPAESGVLLTMSGAKQKIMEIVTGNPQFEFSAKDLAQECAHDIREVNLILGNLVRTRKIEKTTAGYRLAPAVAASQAAAV